MPFFLLIILYSKEAEICSTDTAFTLRNYFHSLPAKPYIIQTSSATLTCQFSKLPLNRAGAKNLVSYSGETQDTSTPPDTGFSDAQATELLGKHPQGILLKAKV